MASYTYLEMIREFIEQRRYRATSKCSLLRVLILQGVSTVLIYLLEYYLRKVCTDQVVEHYGNF